MAAQQPAHRARETILEQRLFPRPVAPCWPTQRVMSSAGRFVGQLDGQAAAGRWEAQRVVRKGQTPGRRSGGKTRECWAALWMWSPLPGGGRDITEWCQCLSPMSQAFCGVGCGGTLAMARDRDELRSVVSSRCDVSARCRGASAGTRSGFFPLFAKRNDQARPCSSACLNHTKSCIVAATVIQACLD